MSRLPGKKFKVETFKVDGMAIDVQLRITDDNEFFAEVGGEAYQAETFEELKAKVRPVLETIHRLEYDPMIEVDYEAGGGRERSSWDRDEGRQNVSLAFHAGWASRTPVSTSEDRGDHYRWVPVKVDGKTGELAPLDEDAKHYAHRQGNRDHEALIPFTIDRWRRLVAIRSAIAATRDKLAAVLDDRKGELLDAIPAGAAMLTALPDAPPAPARRRRR